MTGTQDHDLFVPENARAMHAELTAKHFGGPGQPPAEVRWNVELYTAIEPHEATFDTEEGCLDGYRLVLTVWVADDHELDPSDKSAAVLFRWMNQRVADVIDPIRQRVGLASATLPTKDLDKMMTDDADGFVEFGWAAPYRVGEGPSDLELEESQGDPDSNAWRDKYAAIGPAFAVHVMESGVFVDAEHFVDLCFRLV